MNNNYFTVWVIFPPREALSSTKCETYCSLVLEEKFKPHGPNWVENCGRYKTVLREKLWFLLRWLMNFITTLISIKAFSSEQVCNLWHFKCTIPGRVVARLFLEHIWEPSKRSFDREKFEVIFNTKLCGPAASWKKIGWYCIVGDFCDLLKSKKTIVLYIRNANT